MEGNIILLILVLWPVLGAVLGYVTGRKNKKVRNLVAVFFTGVEFIILLILLILLQNGKEFYFMLSDFGIDGIALKLDGFRGVFCLLAAFLWMMVTIFSFEYFENTRNRNRYYFFMTATLGFTVGIFLSADLLTTFLFFEVMSFSSYTWVIQEETKKALRAANSYLFITVMGGLVMLMGLFLIYNTAGTLEIEMLYQACQGVEEKGVLYAAGGCLLFGFGAKAGMFPIHYWLPKAYTAAPAPATALLSGILSKCGLFGVLIITCDIFRLDTDWGSLLLILGVITMLLGAVLALLSVDIMRTLACSSMSQIGFILVGIGMVNLTGENNVFAVRGTFLHMINHSLTKLVLFVIAGIIFMNLQKYKLNNIRGFGRKKPLLLFAFLAAALGNGGIPLLNGYISKTLLHESMIEYSFIMKGTELYAFAKTIEWMFLIAGGLTIAYMTKLFVVLFLDAPSKEVESWERKNVSYIKKPTAAILAVIAGILPLLGLFPNIIMDRIADMGQGFFHGEEKIEQVSYFSFANLSGALISIGIGVVFYFVVVKYCIRKKEKDGMISYKNIWPGWLDLEELVYRPVVLSFLPFVFAVICRTLDCLVNVFTKLIKITLLRPVKVKKELPVGARITLILGTMLDEIVAGLNKTIYRKKPIKKSFVSIFELGRLEANQTSRLITRSVSFGLLLFCIGLLVTLYYLLFIV